MISVLCPTRGRPQGVQRLITTACKTADGDIEFIFYKDDDDPPYPDSVFNTLDRDVPVRVLVGPRIQLSQTWNECWKLANGNVFFLADDDVAFRTKGWDTDIKAAINQFPDKIAVAWGRDGFWEPPACATQPFTSREWTDVVGYFTPTFISGFVDKWLYELALEIDRGVYVESVYTEHMHYLKQKSEFDQTYMDRVKREQTDDVAKNYADREPERLRDAEKLRQAIADFQ